jgi:hypothetical protein
MIRVAQVAGVASTQNPDRPSQTEETRGAMPWTTSGENALRSCTVAPKAKLSLV